MKHMANCTTEEFFKQAPKLREPLAEWIKLTDIGAIRAKYSGIADEKTPKEKVAQLATLFFGEAMAAGLEKAPEQTMELLCLSTFTDPEDFNTHTQTEYRSAAIEMYLTKDVRDFFTLLLAPSLWSSSDS